MRLRVDDGAEPLEPEEQARCRGYALVSRLFYGPADPGLLAEISHTGGDREGEEGADAGSLLAAWRDLQQACRGASPERVRQEFDTLFVGVGRAEVSPYLSGYAEPAAPDRYVVRLRERLAAWGLARRPMVFEVEDHISGVCDVMRRLIEDRFPLGRQREFFDEFAYPGVSAICAAVQKAPSAQFYRSVAEFARAFYDVDRIAFEMSAPET